MVDDPRVERVARAMCAARDKNPDGEHPTGKMVATKAPGVIGLEPEVVKEWAVYVSEARVFLAPLDVATGS